MAVRLIVCGSLTWKDRYAVETRILEAFARLGPPPPASLPTLIVVHGAATEGADLFAHEFCEANRPAAAIAGAELVEEPHPADWRNCGPTCPPLARRGHRQRNRRGEWYCPTAGFRRNQAMADLGADECLAFIDPCTRPRCRRPKPHGSHGTDDMIRRATKAGIPVRRFP